MNQCKTYLEKIHKLQKWAARIISNSHYRSHSAPLLRFRHMIFPCWLNSLFIYLYLGACVFSCVMIMSSCFMWYNYFCSKGVIVYWPHWPFDYSSICNIFLLCYELVCNVFFIVWKNKEWMIYNHFRVNWLYWAMTDHSTRKVWPRSMTCSSTKYLSKTHKGMNQKGRGYFQLECLHLNIHLPQFKI